MPNLYPLSYREEYHLLKEQASQAPPFDLAFGIIEIPVTVYLLQQRNSARNHKERHQVFCSAPGLCCTSRGSGGPVAQLRRALLRAGNKKSKPSARIGDTAARGRGMFHNIGCQHSSLRLGRHLGGQRLRQPAIELLRVLRSLTPASRIPGLSVHRTGTELRKVQQEVRGFVMSQARRSSRSCGKKLQSRGLKPLGLGEVAAPCQRPGGPPRPASAR